MQGTVISTLVFDVGGRGCTDATIDVALRRANELGINYFIAASTTGWTARKVINAKARLGFSGKIIIVAEHTGYHHQGVQGMPDDVRDELQREGAAVFFGTHALSGVARSFRLRWGGIDTNEIVAETLRRFSRGVKTCVEAAIMAADANLVPVNQDVIGIGGSGGGADSAVVLRPTNMNSFFNIKVREIVALPRLRVAEVLEPVIRANEAKPSRELASELGVSIEVIDHYRSVHASIRQLQKQGLSLESALRQVEADGDVLSTYVALQDPSRH